MSVQENYTHILKKLPKEVRLIAVSKTHPVESIKKLYQLNHRNFGENKVQELVEKYNQLPKDIKWHLIGHLQTNKVKQIVSFIYLIHSIDSLKLIRKVNIEAQKIDKKISVLLQLKIAQESTKYGLSIEELEEILLLHYQQQFSHISIEGIMAMASFTENKLQIESEFEIASKIFMQHKEKYQLKTLCLGMSSDYLLAIKKGSTMIRVGSKIFGKRKY